VPEYIHQLANWPTFQWKAEALDALLADVRHRQGLLIGQMKALGFNLQQEAVLHTLTEDVLKSSEIEGEILDKVQVRSSIARRLGMDIGALPAADRHVEGVVEMMLDATQDYGATLSEERIYGWHAALFPTGRSGIHKIDVGRWRRDLQGPMQVISGAVGKERVHYEAPGAHLLEGEMRRFLDWFNNDNSLDPILKAAIAHLWFVTIHPLDDGNGRTARAIADMALARSERSPHRFYSMSAQIRLERKQYYDMLEATQKGGLDITEWLKWFLECLRRAFEGAETTLRTVLHKAAFWKKHPETEFNPRQRDMLNQLLDGFFGKLTSSKWAKIEKCSQDTASRDINDLVERGLLRRESAGRGTAYFLTD
jgi:Fic family protein